ncbi:hypothetical protein D3C78_1832040 [compost metagenome]
MHLERTVAIRCDLEPGLAVPQLQRTPVGIDAHAQLAVRRELQARTVLQAHLFDLA